MANFYKKSQFAGGGEQPEKSQKGRSMIEMLGVLAIIGVLSIAGIAAYSQAMFKYQLTTQAEAINLLFHRAIELQPILQREYGRKITGGQNVAKIMAETEMLPNGIFYDAKNTKIYDVFKNNIVISYQRSSRSDGGSSTDYIIEILMNRDDDKITDRDRAICRNIFQAAQQNADNISNIGMRSYKDSGYSSKSLGGKTLREAGIAEINNVCNSCNSQRDCVIIMYISVVLH